MSEEEEEQKVGQQEQSQIFNESKRDEQENRFRYNDDDIAKFVEDLD